VGRIVASYFISLDGVVEAPDQWHFPYFNDEMGASIGRASEVSGAFLMGRTLYDEWSEYWPDQDDDVPFSSFINEIPKYVVSSTLDQGDVTWSNTTVVPGDPARLVAIRDATEGDITMSGSATTARWLLAEGLLDELHLLVHPIVVGRGQKLFEGTGAIPLALAAQETFATGVLDLTYTPAP
jgi:dihydrofolate reductase